MPFEMMKKIVKKQEVNLEELKGKELILTKIIGFGNLYTADKLNKYLFVIDPEIYAGLIISEGQNLGRMPIWLRKQKRKNDDIDKLIVKYFEKYNLSKKLLEEQYQAIRSIVESDMKIFLKELGADEKTFKKYGINLTEVKVKKGLEKWFD